MELSTLPEHMRGSNYGGDGSFCYARSILTDRSDTFYLVRYLVYGPGKAFKALIRQSFPARTSRTCEHILQKI
jgi:hypothetical protein